MSGRLAYTLCELHEEYGEVVRIGPGELSFAPASDQLWKTIYARRPEMPKSLSGTGFPPPPNGVHGIVTGDNATHGRIRKALSAAFSQHALRDQESFLQDYVNKLMRSLQPLEAPVDLVDYFNWTAFDIVSDLTFGESFGGLDKSEYHPWVHKIFETIHALTYVQFALAFGLTPALRLVFPGLVKARTEFFGFAFDKIDDRTSNGNAKGRKDFIGFIQDSTDDSVHLGRQELHTTAASFLLAGSETAATHLSGTIFFLLAHPDEHARLRNDIRTAFQTTADITMQAASHISYLGYVIQESFRMYPPGPITFPRVVTGAGEHLNGHWVPAGTVVGINHYSTYRSSRNFHRPRDFLPKRWLPESEREAKFHGDNRSVLKPFSYGPHDCIGKNLAYAEIRLVLCQLLFQFDLELCEESRDWTKQRVFGSWEKVPLMVRLRERHE